MKGLSTTLLRFPTFQQLCNLWSQFPLRLAISKAIILSSVRLCTSAPLSRGKDTIPPLGWVATLQSRPPSASLSIELSTVGQEERGDSGRLIESSEKNSKGCFKIQCATHTDSRNIRVRFNTTVHTCESSICF